MIREKNYNIGALRNGLFLQIWQAFCRRWLAILLAGTMPVPLLLAVQPSLVALVDHRYSIIIEILVRAAFMAPSSIIIIRLTYDSLHDRCSTVESLLMSALYSAPLYLIWIGFLMPIILAIAAICFIVPAFFVYGRMTMIGPVIVIEGASGLALDRSFVLTRNYALELTGISAASAVIGVTIMILALLPIATLATLTGFNSAGWGTVYDGAFLVGIYIAMNVSSAVIYHRLSGAYCGETGESMLENSDKSTT